MVHPEAFGIVVDETEEPVIRADEIITFRHGDDRPPAAADSGIDDSEVNRPLREMAVGGLQDVGCFPDVLRGDFIRDVDDLSLRVDLEDDPFHARRKGISRPKIGCQCYNGGHQSPGMDRIVKTVSIISAHVRFVNRGLGTCCAGAVSTPFVIPSAAENPAVPGNCRTLRGAFPFDRL